VWAFGSARKSQVFGPVVSQKPKAHTIQPDSIKRIKVDSLSSFFGNKFKIELKSLILAQIERWRHALHMQVERQHGGNPGGEWRTGE
jgi:hypothetical protein